MSDGSQMNNRREPTTDVNGATAPDLQVMQAPATSHGSLPEAFRAGTLCIRRENQGPATRLAGIDLPDLIQNLGQARRTGILSLTQGDQKIDLLLQEGAIAGADHHTPGALARALRWIGFSDPTLIHDLGLVDIETHDDASLGDQLSTVLPADLLIDAVSAHIEEMITVALGWNDVATEFREHTRGSSWLAFQQRLDIGLAASSLLMEGLRRHDELRIVQRAIPVRWDVVVPAGAASPSDDDAQHLLDIIADGCSMAHLLDRALAAPWRVRETIGRLVKLGSLRCLGPQELIAWASDLRDEGHLGSAEGAFRRCLELQPNDPELLATIADLAGERGDQPAALEARIEAARAWVNESPERGLEQVDRAIADGGDQLIALPLRAQLHVQLGQEAAAIADLFELADQARSLGDWQTAIDALMEAEHLGADRVACTLRIAEIHQAAGNNREATLACERAAVHADTIDDQEGAARARRLLLMFQPHRLDAALSLARFEADLGNANTAATTLREALTAADQRADDPGTVVLVCRELLAELDPGDDHNGDLLAHIYQQRQDRDAAIDQLLRLADAQEAESRFVDAVETLERVLGFGASMPDIRGRHARLCSQIGRDRVAITSWLRTLDLLEATGDLTAARQIAEEAVAAYAGEADLHQRLAVIALRQDDRQPMIQHFRAAANAARASGDLERAYQTLRQLQNFEPDDLRIELDVINLAMELDLVDRDEALSHIAKVAPQARSAGQGEFARPGFDGYRSPAESPLTRRGTTQRFKAPPLPTTHRQADEAHHTAEHADYDLQDADPVTAGPALQAQPNDPRATLTSEASGGFDSGPFPSQDATLGNAADPAVPPAKPLTKPLTNTPSPGADAQHDPHGEPGQFTSIGIEASQPPASSTPVPQIDHELANDAYIDTEIIALLRRELAETRAQLEQQQQRTRRIRDTLSQPLQTTMAAAAPSKPMHGPDEHIEIDEDRIGDILLTLTDAVGALVEDKQDTDREIRSISRLLRAMTGEQRA